MQQLIKDVLQSIVKIGKSTDVCLGRIIQTQLFCNNALLIDNNDNVYCMYDLKTHNGNNELIIFDLLSTLSNLERQNYIYVVQKVENTRPILFYEHSSFCDKNQFENRYNIGNEMVLSVDEDVASIEKQGEKILEGSKLPEILSQSVVRYLTSIVFPTEDLKDFVNRNYQSEEIRQTKRANRISIISVVVAILIAISAPFLTIWWGNTHGKNTITELQFKSLLQSIRDSKTMMKDTIYIRETAPLNVVIQSQKQTKKSPDNGKQ